MGNIHSINIGGSTYVIEPKTVKINDVRGSDRATSYFADYSLTPWFNEKSGFSTSWASGITMKGWTNDYQSWQLASGSTSSLQPELKFRNGINDAWQPWKKVILEGDAATSASSIYVTYNPSSNNSYSVPFMDYGHTQNSKIYSDNTFKYNPNTNTLTATKFAGIATSAQQSGKIAIHTMEHIISSGICSLNGMYEVPVILGGCDCTSFLDQIDTDYFALASDYHPQTNNSNWLRYNFNDQTLKSTNFEGNLNGTATKVKVTNKGFGMSYLAFFDDKTSGGRYAYSYSQAFMNFFTGEMQIPNLRLKHTNNNYSSYLRFGDGNYSYIWESPDDTLRIHSSNGLFVTNRVTASNFSGNLTGNVTGNVAGNLTGRVLPKTSTTTAIEMTYTGVSGIEYHSNISRHANGSNYYAGTAYGFPALSNANGVLNIETHPFGGASYYLHQIGFSSDNGLYHRAFHGNNPKSASSTPSNQNGKTWNSIPLGKPSNYGQVRNIEVVTSMPSTPNSYTLYLVLG